MAFNSQARCCPTPPNSSPECKASSTLSLPEQCWLHLQSRGTQNHPATVLCSVSPQPTGVFSRLGDLQEDKAPDSDDDSSVLQYAGVLKRPSQPKDSCKVGVTIKAKATSSEPKQVMAAAATTAIQRRGSKSVAGPAAPAKEEEMQGLPSASGSVAKRLGKRSLKLLQAQDSSVTSSRSRPDSSFRVTINRTLGSSKVSSSSPAEPPSAQMDHTGTVSVFKRLGRKTV